MTSAWLRTLPLAAALLLAACASAPIRPVRPLPAPPPPLPAQPPGSPTDLGQVPDAVPRDEPRSALGNPPFYVVAGRRYAVMASANGYIERGVASWYGADFHGLKTSTGEPYDMFAMTAAHKTLPLPCYARVTNLSNGRSVVVRINDRGPFVANRIIDLSYTAAVKLDMIRNGTAFVQVETLSPAAPVLTAALPATTPAASAASVGVSSVPPVSVPPDTTAPSAPPSAAAAPPAAAVDAASNAGTPAAAVVAGPAGSNFYIQVGAYASSANAQRVAQRLRDAGVDPVVTLPPDARQLQRVRVGPIASVQQFDGVIARLNALGFHDARLAQD